MAREGEVGAGAALLHSRGPYVCLSSGWNRLTAHTVSSW